MRTGRFFSVVLGLVVGVGCGSKAGLKDGGGGGSGGNAGSGGNGGNAGGAGSGSGGGAGDGGGFRGDGSSTTTCMPGMGGTFIIDCGYPFASADPRTSIVFNESEVLRAFQPSDGKGATVKVFFNDEHALTLGVRHVDVKTSSGTTPTDYPVSPLPASPSSVLKPMTGADAMAGGLDVSGRPMWPSLFITDVTSDPNNRMGDWQHGGTARPPDAVFGSWKAAVRTVDQTKSPPAVSVTPDKDPAKNNWSLDMGDPAPAGLTNQGFGAEVRWNVDDLGFVAGHSYRLQVMVHDGDQTRVGGDSGEACVLFCATKGSCPAATTNCN